jgi:hypothetical protein
MHIILIVVVAALVLYILFKAAKVMIKVIAVLAILLAAYLTNPDVADHHAAVQEKAGEDVSVRFHDITIKDFKLFSLTQNKDGIIGIGIFTKVWIFRL